ncbi:MAG: 1-deoxy-D-xylulose-5-phosphate synthase [Micromonosporaceae bacterium]|nr:1-deoxy-D-xylulose-5-phosphate synthase [Micromonosporaceae bacterium]
MSMLDTVDSPDRLKELPAEDLPALAAEIRDVLVSSVSRTGGHLGPNLGAVELTIALHRVFDSPRDAIVWDTGHQAYVHKLLTGRRDLSALRQRGGLSGYPSRAESVHDLVENSHASTALSYADGLAKAFALRDQRDRAVVAVVGDGALTGGMCWEALNNIGAAPHRPIIVVLNDNGRSYSPTVGALAANLARLRDGSGPSVFEALGLAYLGPVDGHDIPAVEQALRRARALGTPVVVHCVTRKGQGYPPAETDEVDCMHAVSPMPAPGKQPSGPSWTQVLADELVALGRERPDVVALTAAMLHPTGLNAFAHHFPDRVFDVGIAEQHAVTSAAGLAMGGLHPVVCVYATFLNRAFDQLLMDVALHRLPVTFVLDRAGVTGSDGPSHNGMWDLSVLSIVPGMRIAAPRDGDQLRSLLREAVDYAAGPSAIRFPKAEVSGQLPAVGRLGEADVLRAHPDAEILILPTGPLAQVALEAADELERSGTPATVVDPRWIIPVDPALVAAAGRHRLVVTVEDNGVAGGFGDGFARAARAAGVRAEICTLGLRQDFLPHGSRGGLLAEQGLDGMGIVAAVKEALGRAVSPAPR